MAGAKPNAEMNAESCQLHQMVPLEREKDKQLRVALSRKCALVRGTFWQTGQIFTTSTTYQPQCVLYEEPFFWQTEQQA